MATSLKYTAQVFFKPAADASLKPGKKAFVSPGADADSMFNALVLNLVDNVQKHPRLNSELLGNILSRHFAYFPEHKPRVPGLMTPAERMQHMLREIPLGNVVESLAYTLRQMAVDELLENPAHYRAAFLAASSGLTEKQMRKPQTPLHECALIALAKKLSLPVEIIESAEYQELPVRRQYNLGVENPKTNPRLVFKKHGQQYSAQVSAPETFENLQMHSGLLKAREQTINHLDLADAMFQIEQDNERLQKKFDLLVNRLSTMVQAGELTKDDLLETYVKNTPTSEEAQSQDLDSKIMRKGCISFKRNRLGVADSYAEKTTEERTISQLVEKLAEAITLGYMNEARVFNEIENRQDASLRSSIA
ncbi:OTU domain-containing protein [Legionella londiniensis]|uniref:Uncharacterized protein n=1 Tax=Legionella londiniensis TaxID=45068 RepID=A0A0W0VJA8_9GAMM|nr:OTU domain-containing protein [Legionella londiniensis]KTD20190.1 hypothetical protein Llon_1811 [Legionella londiniensis]